MKSLSCVWSLATPWTSAQQTPPSMGFPGNITGVGCHCLLHLISISLLWSLKINYWIKCFLLLMDLHLFLCSGLCKQCCNEHLGACIFWSIVFSRYMPRSGVSMSHGCSFLCYNLHSSPLLHSDLVPTPYLHELTHYSISRTHFDLTSDILTLLFTLILIVLGIFPFSLSFRNFLFAEKCMLSFLFYS